MEMMIDVVRLLGLIAIASGMVALIFLLWRFISGNFREAVEVERYRVLNRELRRFLALAKKAGSAPHPHPKALAEWLEAGMEGNEVPDAARFLEQLKALEIPQIKQRDEEINRLKAHIRDLEALATAVRRYREKAATPETMLTEAERYKQESEKDAAALVMYEALAKVGSENPS